MIQSIKTNYLISFQGRKCKYTSTQKQLAMRFEQEGLTLEDAKKMIAKLENVGANTVVITDEPKICGKNTLITIKNTGCEYTMAFILALAMQKFALKLVVAKGIDPDKSNVIAKITITK